MADVRTVEDHLRPSDLKPFHSQIQGASIVMLDANLCTETLEVRVQSHITELFGHHCYRLLLFERQWQILCHMGRYAIMKSTSV